MHIEKKIASHLQRKMRGIERTNTPFGKAAYRGENIGLNGDGHACKWAGSDAFMDMVQDRENGNKKDAFMDMVQDRDNGNKKEEEEHLYRNTNSIARFFVRPVEVIPIKMPFKEPKTGYFEDTGQWIAA